ncbi:MAG: methyltransferase domain-containing protein [Chloroflexi bacterium]|nr:methyltransferase domain-containing protein [Chloroflexota bacterium]
MSQGDKYIPALGHKSLTPLYDPLLSWVMREETFKRALIKQANIGQGQRVLDLGCGTATLTILVKQTHPEAEVVGLDGDTQVLEIGRAKAAKAGVDIKLDHGLAFQLPYPDASFDRVLSSLVFHHLAREDKQRALNETFRVLRPGGELHLVDFGKPHNAFAHFISQFVRRLERAADNIEGRLPEMMRHAGFEKIEEPAWFTTVFGSLSSYKALRSKE